MYKNGHRGISMLLSSPFISLFLIYEKYLLCAIFLIITLGWSSLPDVDIHLQDYGDISFTSYPYKHWIWIPIMILTHYIMNIVGIYIDKVPRDYDLDSPVSHRGLTHSMWFAISIAIYAVVISSLLTTASYFIGIKYYPEIFSQIQSNINSGPYLINSTVFLASFFSVKFHCVGDIFTPSGIHYLTPRTDYGFTIDQFYAKNEVANRSALPLGLISMLYGIFFGIFFGKLWIGYLLSGFLGIIIIVIPIWLVFVKTRIGEWFYFIWDGLN